MHSQQQQQHQHSMLPTSQTFPSSSTTSSPYKVSQQQKYHFCNIISWLCRCCCKCICKVFRLSSSQLALLCVAILSTYSILWIWISSQRLDQASSISSSSSNMLLLPWLWKASSLLFSSSSSSSSSFSFLSDTTSACLLVMDDNHFLIEWIAYHYHTMNLQSIIVMTDPKAQTSPHEILQRWSNSNLMEIIEWQNDSDFMTEEEFQQAQQDVLEYFGAGSGGDEHILPQLVEHRARQRMFYYKCLQHYKQQSMQQQEQYKQYYEYHNYYNNKNNNKNNIHHDLQYPHNWVLLIDTDEFITINYKTVYETYNNMTAAPPMNQSGAITQFLHDQLQITTTTTTSTNNEYNNNNKDIDEKNSNQLLIKENQPLFLLQSSPCIQIPRLRFGAQETNNETTTTTSHLIHLPDFINITDFLTLRYKTHAAPFDYKKNKISKTIIDVSRITNYDDILPVDSIHMPIRSICQQRKLHIRTSQSFLQIHHYLGSLEQYTYRDYDARSGNRKTNQRSIQQWMDAQNFKNAVIDDNDNDNSNHSIQSWLPGFIQEYETKRRRLQEQNQQRQQSSSSSSLSLSLPSAQELLKNVGKLDNNRGWYSYKGDPTQDRCAILFFGLPRAYRNMVLPSIVRNILIPNARHNCDVYIHFYLQYNEVAGRKNRGGKVDPTEIFLLQSAVQAVQRQYNKNNTKNNNNNYFRNANREPIIAFTHDTEEEFWDKRGADIQRYHTTLRPQDGRPTYYPWLAKTYTNSSLDNIVKQWHSIEYVFKLMQFHAKTAQLPKVINYTRVAMFRNDAMYMTPIDIAMLDKGMIDSHNHHVVVAPFARLPINDRMIYGPFDAVKIWATKRFELIEQRAKEQSDPGYIMHSERFLNASIFPIITDTLGYEININRDICFVRTRADESAMVTDCSVGGITRGWDNQNKKALVEDIVKRNCTIYKMGFKWTFVGCGEGIHYVSGKE